MRISSARTNYPKGAVAIVYANDSSPYIGGYRFNALDASSPWKAKYADPTLVPTVSGLDDRNSAIAVAPSNRHVLYGANGCSALSIYDFDFRLGFTGGLEKAESNSGEFSNISGLLFLQNEKALMVSSTDPSGNSTDSSFLGSYVWDGSASGSSVVGARNWFATGGFYPISSSYRYDITSIASYQSPVLQSGTDEFIVTTHSFTPTLGVAQSIKIWDSNTGAQTDFFYTLSATQSSSPLVGKFVQPVAISPIPATYNDQYVGNLTASTMVLVGHYGGQSYIQATDIQDGVNAAFNPDSRSALLPSYSTANTVRYCMFDPYGRLILAQSDSPYLRIYSQDFSNGQFTLVDSYSSWAGGTINSLAYDKDQDVLFVASQSAPYITAFQMSRSGFDFKYPDMTPSISDAGSSVIRMSLVYDEDWKSYNA